MFLQLINLQGRVSPIPVQSISYEPLMRYVAAMDLDTVFDKEQKASEQFLVFLRNFYAVFPKYKHMDVR